MKFLMGFIVGIVCGIAISVLLFLIIKPGVKGFKEDGLTLFEEPSACVTTNSLKVMQILDSNKVLVRERKFIFSTSKEEAGMADVADDIFSLLHGMILDVPVMLLIGKESEHFYDEQVINIPAKQCAKQIGIYEYRNEENIRKTIPAVSIQ